MLDTKDTERLGVSKCEHIFAKNSIIFREQSIADYGIDAIIETKENNIPTGKMIAVQIKSGESFFRETEDDCIVYRLDTKHRDYWINHSLPVIIVLYSPSQDECIWELVSKENLTLCKSQWKILIRKDQTLENSCAKLHTIAQNMSEYEHRHASLVFAKEWMLEARERGYVILEVGEWVNKSSGKGDFLLKSVDDTGDEITLFERTLWGFGIKPYSSVIQEMFPWANVVIDQDFYEENFEFERPTKLPTKCIFPYCNVAGEVDHYRLLLSLNPIGKAFLAIEDFLENGKLYKIDHLA